MGNKALVLEECEILKTLDKELAAELSQLIEYQVKLFISPSSFS